MHDSSKSDTTAGGHDMGKREQGADEIHLRKGSSPRGSSANWSRVVDAIIEVGRRRNAILELMRVELQCGNNEAVLRLARELCGLADERTEGHRTDPRVD